MNAQTPLIDIHPDHWAIVRRILQKHVPQYAVWAFGSRAKWSAKEYSDLDLAIITEKPLPLSISAALDEDFSESDLPWKVDVVDWASTSDAFRKAIAQDKIVLQMPDSKSGWHETTLGEVIEFKRGYDLPKKQRLPGSIPLVSSSGVSDKHAKAMVKGPGVITGRYGTIGQVFYIREDFWPLNTTLYVCDFKGNDPRFISFFLRNLDFFSYSDKAAVPGVNRNDLHQAKIRFPADVEEQRAIAHILGTLDDKIELNRKQNETLEATAQAIFKAWFVDFDPVRAKMEGRWQRGQSLPGLPAHLYDLFPDRLVESELGEIPEGWKMRSLDSIANYLNGLALQKFPPESETEFLPVIKIAQLRAGNTNGADKASAQIKPDYVVVDGDVLFSWSGSLEVEVWNGGRGALNQHLFKITSNEVPKWFYFFATRHHLPDFRAIAAGKATTMGHIQRKHLADARIAVAPPESMKKFDALISPQFDQMINNAQQSRILAQLRDTLLPKLVSGELRIQNIRAVEKNS